MSEITDLHATAAARRAAGLPCNPMREGWDDIDWLDEAQLQRLHVLGLRLELERLRAVCKVPA